MTDATPSARLRAAREQRGLTPQQIAAAVGLPVEWYHDLESYPEEMFSNVSLAHLQALCMTVNIKPQALLLGDDKVPATAEVDFSTLVEELRTALNSSKLSVEAFSNKVGWELKDLLVDPQELRNFNVDGLKDVCAAANVNWLAVLSGLQW